MLHIYAIPQKTLQKHFEGNHSVKSSKKQNPNDKNNCTHNLMSADGPHVIAVPTET
jgi:hypothetical protein